MIRAVLSDGGHIVFDDTATKMKPFLAVSKHLPGLTYSDFRQLYMPFKITAQTQEDYSSEDAMHDYLSLIGYSDLYETVNGELGSAKMPLMPHVKETLEALYASGTIFIILTNASEKSDELRKGHVKAGIGAYVKDVISSKDIGVRKPDPYFFNFALQKHKLKKEDVIFIAHDDDELQGAHNLGFVVYALNVSKTQDLAYLPKDRLLSDFSEIERIVAASQKMR